MDTTDEKIIEEFKQNGRASFTDVAEKIGVSEGTVRNRVKKLQEAGIIEKFTVKTRDQKNFKAFVSVKVSTSRGFEQITSDMPQGVEIYELAGDIDLFVKVSGRTSSEINEAVDEIRAINGVQNTKTYMILSQQKT